MSNSVKGGAPVLDIEEGLQRLGNSWEMYSDMLQYFCKDKLAFFPQFRSLLDKGDYEGAGIAAHSLKGSAATLAAAELRDMANRLEAACDRGDHACILAEMAGVEASFHRVREAARRIVSGPME